jgi:hypothetical protein
MANRNYQDPEVRIARQMRKVVMKAARLPEKATRLMDRYAKKYESLDQKLKDVQRAKNPAGVH